MAPSPAYAPSTGDPVAIGDYILNGVGDSIDVQVGAEAADLFARFGPMASARLAVLLLKKAAYRDSVVGRTAVIVAGIAVERVLPQPQGKHHRLPWIKSPRGNKHRAA